MKDSNLDRVHRLAVRQISQTLPHRRRNLESARRMVLVKRIVDLALTIPALIVLLPILGIVALLVRFALGGAVFFRQERPGLGEKPFILLKFRTMNDARDAAGKLRPDGERLTPFGRFLRRSSLDELPGLFNILRGELSLVGPRPLLTRYLPYYSDRERLRHAVRPGLTGWAQINGRNYLPWDERLELDVWYVENWSLRLDFQILARTIFKVLRREGVAADTDEVEPDLDQERRRKWPATVRGFPQALGKE